MGTQAQTRPAIDSTDYRIAIRDSDGDELEVRDSAYHAQPRVMVTAHELSNDDTRPMASVALDADAARELRDFLTRWLDEHAPAVNGDDLDAWAAERTEAIERGDDEPTEYEASVLNLPRTEPLAAWERELLDADDEPETVTAEAERIVYGRGEDDYGHPREDFTRTAIIWQGLLHHKLADGTHVEPEDVARCMIGVKLARDVHTPKRDNRVDGAGYFLTLDRLATGK